MLVFLICGGGGGGSLVVVVDDDANCDSTTWSGGGSGRSDSLLSADGMGSSILLGVVGCCLVVGMMAVPPKYLSSAVLGRLWIMVGGRTMLLLVLPLFVVHVSSSVLVVDSGSNEKLMEPFGGVCGSKPCAAAKVTVVAVVVVAGRCSIASFFSL